MVCALHERDIKSKQEQSQIPRLCFQIQFLSLLGNGRNGFAKNFGTRTSKGDSTKTEPMDSSRHIPTHVNFLDAAHMCKPRRMRSLWSSLGTDFGNPSADTSSGQQMRTTLGKAAGRVTLKPHFLMSSHESSPGIASGTRTPSGCLTLFSCLSSYDHRTRTLLVALVYARLNGRLKHERANKITGAHHRPP